MPNASHLSPNTELLRILSQSLVSQGDVLRAFVRALVDKPPDGDKDGQTTGHQTGVVHRPGRNRQVVREAEDDSKGDDVDARQRVDNISDRIVHEEPPGDEGGTTGQDVWEDGHEVGQTGQLNETSDKGTESGC
jgi:hypothetical protein